jgi:cytochrome b pre-mRNA-processing protein 3
MILSAFRRNSRNDSIHALYGAIVAQARSPAFYTSYGVPDTLDGRFDLVVLHLVLLLLRLARDGGAGEAGRHGPAGDVGQRLFDAFCRDLDGNLREMGVGDLAVPKKMRRFGEAFYGRLGAYRAALEVADDRELEKALARNIFGVEGVDERAGRLACYVRAAARQLDREEEDALLAGKMMFPCPESFAHAS